MCLINIDQLVKWLGYESGQVKRAEHWLQDNRVPYLIGKGGLPCTTLEAINTKLIGDNAIKNINDSIEF